MSSTFSLRVRNGSSALEGNHLIHSSHGKVKTDANLPARDVCVLEVPGYSRRPIGRQDGGPRMILVLNDPDARRSEEPRWCGLSRGTPVPAFKRGGARATGQRGRRARSWLLAAVVAATCPVAAASTGEFRWDPKESVVGGIEIYKATFDDTLLDVARRFGMGIEEMKLANPGVDLWLPGEGTAIQLPSRFVLPSGPRRGIVINVPEMRLYYYPKDGGRVRTWPIGIGRLEYETPLGKTSVVRKKVGPVWYPTDTIREEYAARGEDLPRMVLPGPENPLGSHAIYLGLPTYLIHGTNRPYSIGMRVSFGCVRLYPEDIVELYDLVALGTPVSLVDQRVKAGWLGDELHLEVHPNPDLPEEEARPSMTDAVRAIITATPEGERPPVDWKLVEAALDKANGIPVVVGKRVTGSRLAGTRRDAAGKTPLRSS